MLVLALLALALGAHDAVAQFNGPMDITTTVGPSAPSGTGAAAVAASFASAVTALPALPSLPPFSSAKLSIPSAPPNIVIASAAEPYHTYQGPYHTGSVATATAVAAAESTPYPSSGGMSGAEIAAITLGVICAFQSVLIAILALRSRNLARRASRFAAVLRDLPPPQSPLMATFTIPSGFMKPMNVVHVAPPPAAAPVVRKLSRKAPPSYSEAEKGGVEDVKVENVDKTYMK